MLKQKETLCRPARSLSNFASLNCCPSPPPISSIQPLPAATFPHQTPHTTTKSLLPAMPVTAVAVASCRQSVINPRCCCGVGVGVVVEIDEGGGGGMWWWWNWGFMWGLRVTCGGGKGGGGGGGGDGGGVCEEAVGGPVW
ncbi:hypothetical protein Drorol1_Dr00020891 [Drosera rotundifolia]